uniref:Glycosyltransferase family 92 protein n=1 Tax=Oryzias latipes TaxID=8090 RepID=A0A3P9MBA4_ORYLA
LCNYRYSRLPVGLLYLRVSPKPFKLPFLTSQQSITPLTNTKHFLVSAFMDQRRKGFDVRIIGIFRRDSIHPLHCIFFCGGLFSETTPASFLSHFAHFGYPFGPVDVLCSKPENCNATHVTLLTKKNTVNISDHLWLPIRNRKTHNKETRMNFTVCISTLFGDYNNVLQVRVHKGDLQYFGQIVTLNECIYRSMERSRYVLLNDIDEIIMPYQHDNLNSMMESTFTPNFLFTLTLPSGRFHLPQWSNVSGTNILEHIYREDPDRKKFLHYKMIVQPKLVQQTSVHEVLRKFGGRYKVPWKLCRFIHIHVARRTSLKLEQLNEDKRLWDFQENLIPNVDKALKRAGLLTEN